MADETTTSGLNDEQLQFLESCEQEFKNRYTDEDSEYEQVEKSELRVPPIVEPWYNKPRRNYDWSSNRRNDRYSDRPAMRSYDGRRDYGYGDSRRSSGNRYRPY